MRRTVAATNRYSLFNTQDPDVQIKANLATMAQVDVEQLTTNELRTLRQDAINILRSALQNTDPNRINLQLPTLLSLYQRTSDTLATKGQPVTDDNPTQDLIERARNLVEPNKSSNS